jgi:hypothetical protein
MSSDVNLSDYTDPTIAVAVGTSLFDTAYKAAGNSGFSGMVASANSAIGGLPAGALKAALQQAGSAASAAASGAAAGALFGPEGAAIGAAVGAVIAIVGDIMNGTPAAPPEGEFRSRAERYCFPYRQPGGSLLTVSQAGGTQQGILPASWPNIRRQVVAYQATDNGNDPTNQATGTYGPLPFTFQTGWVPPPFSTDTSTGKALALAQAFVSGDDVTSYLVSSKAYQNYGLNADPSQVSGEINLNTQAAITAFDGDENGFNQAIALVERWYGAKFPQIVWAVTPESDNNGKLLVDPSLSDLAYANKLSSVADTINKTACADGIYYISRQFVIMNAFAGNPSGVGPAYGVGRGAALALYNLASSRPSWSTASSR